MSIEELVAENANLRGSLRAIIEHYRFSSEFADEQAKHRDQIRKKLVLIGQALGVQGSLPPVQGESVAQAWERFTDRIADRAKQIEQEFLPPVLEPEQKPRNTAGNANSLPQ